MIQPWQRVARQKVTQNFSPSLEISFPSLGDDEGAESPLIIEAEIGGHQISRNLEVYVDDLVIKSCTEDEVIRDIEETFKTLKKINMKLNPRKCIFGVEEGMFLGYQVNTKGINICPDKVDAVLSLQSPKCLKDVQKLNGKLASLNRFLAKSAEKSLPFFKTLKKCTKKSDFYWTEEAELAFKQMKELIAKLPMLTVLEEKEELIIYLSTSKEAISVVLMTKREARQMPIYFASRALRGLEINYTSMEKLVLALVHASKRLRRPRTSVKGQVLADFIVERPEEADPDSSIKEEEPLPAQWTLFTDGSSCIDGCGVGVILTDPEGAEFTYALPFQFEATKNKAEYEALIARLRIAEKIGVQNLQVNVDSKLEIHEGSCSMHAGTRSVVSKALRIGYYWSTMHKDARALIRACQECQVHKPVPRNTQEKLNPITSPWLFYKWGIDIAGPFPEGPGKAKFLIVAMDYFTKWIEAKPVTTITGNQVKKFVWGNIVCRFGLPGEIISDNRKQFRDNPFKDWCEKLCIQQHFASVKQPQTNELVERANRSLGEGIKARLGKDNKNWMEEVSHVLWAHRTMIKSSNGDTPFSLTYGTEAVIPAEIGMPTFRTTEVDTVTNDEALEINLELLEEKREQAAIREAKSKRKMEKYYNSKV
ncbi:reverse transcriptase domain-containing protein [Tanacetum coccineum]